MTTTGSEIIINNYTLSTHLLRRKVPARLSSHMMVSSYSNQTVLKKWARKPRRISSLKETRLTQHTQAGKTRLQRRFFHIPWPFRIRRQPTSWPFATFAVNKTASFKPQEQHGLKAHPTFTIISLRAWRSLREENNSI